MQVRTSLRPPHFNSVIVRSKSTSVTATHAHQSTGPTAASFASRYDQTSTPLRIAAETNESDANAL
jgi:hypothetical protein